MHRLFAKCFVFLFCFFFTNLYAFLGQNNWGNFCIEGEWLYFRPAVDVSLVSTANQVGIVQDVRMPTNNADFDSGWRISAGYQFCDCPYGLCFRWTQFETHHTESLSGNRAIAPLFLVIVGSGTGTTRLRYCYHSFDGLFRRNVLCCNCFNLDLLAGIQYATTEVKERVQFTGTPLAVLEVRQRSRFCGVGPELGIDFCYNLWCNFALTGRGFGSLLASRADHHENGTSTTGSVSLVRSSVIDRMWRIVPAGNIRFGLRYTFGCFFAEGGYEAIAYIRALPMLTSTATTRYFRTWSSATLHGPFIAAGLTF